MKKGKVAKKLLVILTVLAMLVGNFGIISIIHSSYAADKVARNSLEYFGRQLTGDAKKIYDAMFHMYSEGIFMRGESYQIGSTSDTTELSIDKLMSFANGDTQLLTDYGAARDAFQNDYPDCFYVNWDQLSIRVTKDANGNFYASLGAGRSDSYLLKGMNENRCSQINGGYGTGIEGAVKQYEAKLNEIVNKIRNKTLGQNPIEDGEYQNTSDVIRMAGEAHDYVVKNMIYKHEYEVTPTQRIIEGHTYEHTDEKSTSRTAYDGLIYGEGVCEAYTRTYKAILDRLGIPCVCVTGVYSPKTSINEPHIWNYVQIDGKWYGVDVTHDDPTNRNWLTKDSTHETREYFLVGEVNLAAHHFPSGIMSSADYKEFTYPKLEIDALRESYKIATDDGFDIEVVKDSQFDGQEVFDSGTYFISYNGKNFTQNAKDGKYIIVRYFTYAPESDEWTTSGWSYLDPWYMAYGEQSLTEKIEPSQAINGKYYVRLELPQVKKAQFAVTDVAPSYLSLRKEFEEKGYPTYIPGTDGKPTPEFTDWSDRMHKALSAGAAFYTEPVDNLKIMTDEIENNWGDYVAPPIATICTPRTNGTLLIGKTHHIKIEYDEDLKKKEDSSVVKIEVSASGGAGIGITNAGSTAAQNCKITGVKWDGKNTVEFDFEPSNMFADDYTFYNFYVTGLIGVKGGRTPEPVTYGIAFQRFCKACVPKGEPRTVYAQPQIIDSSEIVSTDWKYRDVESGETGTLGDLLNDVGAENKQTFLDTLTERLTLVTAEASDMQSREMQNALENSKYKEDFEKAGTRVNTYNIDILVCRKQIVETGEYIRVCLGFPAGTTYEDYASKGTFAFKAYHYKVDKETDKLTGEVEEIPVTVTPQGLILLVNSFSPFTVIASENEVPVIPTEKEVVVQFTPGGKITSGDKVEEGGDGIIKLKEGETKTLTITPDEGYEIDYIILNGERITVNDKSGETLEIKYEFINTGETLNVGFVTKQVHKEEEDEGLTGDIEEPKDPEDTYHPEEEEVPPTTEEPENPGDADDPETPEDPNTPENPNDPGTTDTPENPDDSETQDTPEDSDKPGDNETQKDPEDTDNPESPENPSIPDKPDEPETSETPDTPKDSDKQEDTDTSKESEEQGKPSEPEKTTDNNKEEVKESNDSGIPKTGDLPIEAFRFTMITSLIGIYLIIKNKLKVNYRGKRFK